MPWGQVKNNDADHMARILSDCDDLGSRITMIPRTFNASQIKAIISRLRFFIGARTHSTIAALSAGVPTISIAYSVKARGINRDIFGEEWMVIPTVRLSKESLLIALDQLVEREKELKVRLNIVVPDLQGSVVSAARRCWPVSDSIPALSVVIPLYNKRATVLRSVDSVVSQLRNGDEVIIVDDGSTDGGADVVEQRYKGLPFLKLIRQNTKVYQLPRNQGARTRVIRM